ncbi:protein-tyrosine-phosphatase [Microlunatus endophyticus]|uniref:Protein-tyrosine-phosphatase n=1 Tax=Microlunatus endophyticus TaxID=1716077 RepID=A0A917SGA3_9ACTN|nr:phosphatase [Microlunatus endophyticus]GGL75507.1 protein-tyrosine-phosphatase [Microlunatus endophyticus]
MVEIRSVRHEGRTYEVHVHHDVVRLPDGTPITAVSFDPADPYARDRDPDFGLYLDPRWRPSWDHDHLDWPDFGVPADRAIVLSDLGSLLDRARQGQSVEIGCLGGHGRTGTALALLAVLAGHPSDDAVAWVRTHYCPKAVETDEQQAYVTQAQ